jgi:cation diffusion facilitator CzcD-associated flavoprotein CzcO
MLSDLRSWLQLGDRPVPTGPSPRIAILGAGVAGLCMAIRLKLAGIESFTIFEKSDGVGGTWRDNTYPGASCDVPSHLYSYSFAPKSDWTRVFAEQPEILAYLEACADSFALRPHLRARTAVTEARWDDDAAEWQLTTDAGDRVDVDVLVSGLGQLNVPFYPDIDGLETFEGITFHSARWNHEVDLTDKRVAVIGNGASAIQFIPRIAESAAHLDVYQRSANWVVPKPDAAYPDKMKATFERWPVIRRAHRAQIWGMLELRWPMFHDGSKKARAMETVARTHLEKQVTDPALRARLTPDYPIGCKRVLISNDYYPSLVRDDVDLITSPIERIVADGVITSDGVHHPADVIIYGTGFQTTNFLAPVEISGRDGQSLHERWAKGAEAYLGVAVDGFPSLFLLYGPNTNLGHNSVMFMMESQVGYVMRAITAMQRDGLTAFDVRPQAMTEYNRGIQAAVHQTVWEAGCRSWYKTSSGKVTNNWPKTTAAYWYTMRTTGLGAFNRRAARTAAAHAGR